jgi:hypothetical protein
MIIFIPKTRAVMTTGVRTSHCRVNSPPAIVGYVTANSLLFPTNAAYLGNGICAGLVIMTRMAQ